MEEQLQLIMMDQGQALHVREYGVEKGAYIPSYHWMMLVMVINIFV